MGTIKPTRVEYGPGDATNESWMSQCAKILRGRKMRPHFSMASLRSAHDQAWNLRDFRQTHSGILKDMVGRSWVSFHPGITVPKKNVRLQSGKGLKIVDLWFKHPIWLWDMNHTNYAYSASYNSVIYQHCFMGFHRFSWVFMGFHGFSWSA